MKLDIGMTEPQQLNTYHETFLILTKSCEIQLSSNLEGKLWGKALQGLPGGEGGAELKGAAATSPRTVY